ncbi:hypothetical protein ILYODFUR_031267 [Ilyodon furcidens]|uniref:Uncharacterized protein n=1 Tax=Ilyodon furcidens TaxID=33524 RepID=A0ABV0UE42_9TELE
MKLFQDFQKPETWSNQPFTDQVHFCCLDIKALDEIRFLILRHSPFWAHGLLLYVKAVDQWGCVFVLFPSKLIFSIRSCSLIFCEETTNSSALLIAFIVLDACTSQLLIRQPIQLSLLIIAPYHGFLSVERLRIAMLVCSRILPSSRSCQHSAVSLPNLLSFKPYTVLHTSFFSYQHSSTLKYSYKIITLFSLFIYS